MAIKQAHTTNNINIKSIIELSIINIIFKMFSTQLIMMKLKLIIKEQEIANDIISNDVMIATVKKIMFCYNQSSTPVESIEKKGGRQVLIMKTVIISSKLTRNSNHHKFRIFFLHRKAIRFG